MHDLRTDLLRLLAHNRQEQWVPADQALDQLAGHGEAMIPGLVAALEDDDAEVRLLAVELLGAAGPRAEAANCLKTSDSGVTSMMFFWKLLDGQIAEVRRVVDQLRRTAIDLKWLPVGDVVHLTDDDCSDGDRMPGKFLLIAADDTVLAPHEVVFFEATPPGDEPRPFGLAAYPGHMEGSSQVVPTHMAGWQWIGVIRSGDTQAVKGFIHRAAELGLEVTASFGGKVLTAKLDETGHVRFEERTGFPF